MEALPAVGALFRNRQSGALYRVERIDPSNRPDRPLRHPVVVLRQCHSVTGQLRTRRVWAFRLAALYEPAGPDEA